MARLVARLIALLVCCCPAAVASTAPLPEGLTFDDGFTWFAIENGQDTANGKPFSKGWCLQGAFRIHGQVPRRSLFRMVVLGRDGQPMTNTKVEGYVPPPLPDALPVMFSDNVIDRQQWNKGEGDFSVQVYYLNGDDDTETLCRTYTITVKKVTRVRGSANNPEADAEQYYVSRHREALSSVVYQRPGLQPTYLNPGGGDTYADNSLEVSFNLSTTDAGAGLPSGHVRIRVDGQRLELQQDQIQLSKLSRRYYQVIHTHRDTPQYRQGNPFAEEINFRQYVAVLPITWGDEAKRTFGYVALEDHPGTWEVDYRVAGDTVRTFRFVVADGRIQPHPEAEAAGLGFQPGATLAETVIPAESKWDKRVVPELIQAGGFWGLGWKSEAMKALAAAAPTIGVAWPQ